MSDWTTTDGRALSGWHRAPPGARTAIVFVGVTFVSLLIPNAVVEGVLSGLGVPSLLPATAPPVGVAGRLALAVAAGWLVAFGYALFEWSAAGRAPVERDRDDSLRVEPLVAGRELGVRFDESPYLAPPPPTPDARLDPGSTLGEPRWQTGAAVEREDDWDRTVQERHRAGEGESEGEGEVFAEHPVDLDAATAEPGNAAEQWDGPADEASGPVAPAAADDEQDEFDRRLVELSLARAADPVPAALPVEEAVEAVAAPDRPTGDDRLTPTVIFADGVRPVTRSPAPPPLVEPIEPTDITSADEPSTDDLLEKLMTLTAERRAPTRSLEPDAADRLADALRTLRTVG